MTESSNIQFISPLRKCILHTIAFMSFSTRRHSSATIVERSLWNAKFQCKVTERWAILPSLSSARWVASSGSPFARLAHVEFGCLSVGGTARKTRSGAATLYKSLFTTLGTANTASLVVAFSITLATTCPHLFIILHILTGI